MNRDRLTLYHGTDARIVAMKKEERLDYFRKCDLVIDYLWTFYKPLMINELVEKEYNGQKILVHKQKIEEYKTLLNEKGYKYMYVNLYEKLNMLYCRNEGAGLYQYGCLYFSSAKYTARNYAARSYAGGELGLIAYRMIEAADIIQFENYNPSKEVSKAIEDIMSFAQEGKEQPIVITVNDVETKNLLNEDGQEVNWDLVFDILESDFFKGNFNFRYTKDMELDLSQAEYLQKPQ